MSQYNRKGLHIGYTNDNFPALIKPGFGAITVRLSASIIVSVCSSSTSSQLVQPFSGTHTQQDDP